MSQTTKGLEALAAKAQARAEAINGAPMQALMGAMAQEMVVRMFLRAASFTPGDVPDLSPDYQLAKQKKWGHAYPILYASGAMLRSMYGIAARTGGATWSLRVGFEGQHPTAKMSNAELANIHINGVHRASFSEHAVRGPRKTALQKFADKATKRGRKVLRALGLDGPRAKGEARTKYTRTKVKIATLLPARDFTKLPPGWEEPWLQRINTLLTMA